MGRKQEGHVNGVREEGDDGLGDEDVEVRGGRREGLHFLELVWRELGFLLVNDGKFSCSGWRQWSWLEAELPVEYDGAENLN